SSIDIDPFPITGSIQPIQPIRPRPCAPRHLHLPPERRHLPARPLTSRKVMPHGSSAQVPTDRALPPAHIQGVKATGLVGPPTDTAGSPIDGPAPITEEMTL